jgi:cation diffusion facilitator CzcD-associated flavoprotein CzcO
LFVGRPSLFLEQPRSKLCQYSSSLSSDSGLEMYVNGTSVVNGDSKVEEFDAVIVGAGFGGIYLLHKLRKLGYKVKVLEAGKWFGGIWWWNSYPGARVDTHWPFYEFAAKELWEDWTWKERFPSRDELVAYFEHVDQKWDLQKDILFDNAVVKADFDDSSNTWTAVTNKGYTAKAQFLLLATGFAAKRYTPKIKGLDTFQGAYHTAAWPEEGVDVKGKKVGIIGTGASGVQVIQEIAPVVEHLTIFQRTANLALPMVQEFYNEKTVQKQINAKKEFPAVFKHIRKTFGGFDYDFLTKSSEDDTPEERIAYWESQYKVGGFTLWLHNYKDILKNPVVNRAMYDFWVDKTRARLAGLDPEFIENLAPLEPVNPWGTKRPSLETHYYETFHQKNIDLYNIKKNPIAEVTPKGVKLSGGQEIELDLLILATGFDAVTGSLLQIDITGANGVKLVDKWAEGTATQLGIATSSFPNMLFMYGPQAPTGFAIGPRISEVQGDWIVGLLEDMKQHHYIRIDASVAAEEKWKKINNDVTAETLMVKAKTWYMGDNVPGKPREALNYMGGLGHYETLLNACTAGGYEGFNLM